MLVLNMNRLESTLDKKLCTPPLNRLQIGKCVVPTWVKLIAHLIFTYHIRGTRNGNEAHEIYQRRHC